MLDIPLFLVLSLAHAEQIPDYDNPYAPIFTDKPVYSWTDKVMMKIIAPSWNENRNLIDSIGATAEHPIKISTRGHSLEPYKFTETSANSGIFTAEVILTGFLHDADGDGDSDTVPRTAGSGPTGGFLEVDRDSAVTISFRFADGVVVSESVPVRWNTGTIKFSQDAYAVDDVARILIVDPDLNLNPESLDRVDIWVSSDSDMVGADLVAVETGTDSGVFAGTIHFTYNGPTSGTRLHALPGDAVYAQYDDHTLPKPYSLSDQLDVKSSARMDFLPQSGVTNIGTFFTDSSGGDLVAPASGSQVQITSSLLNEQDFSQSFTYVVQVKDESGLTVHVSWIQSEIAPDQRLAVSQSWLPERSGTYIAEAFVWNSLSKLIPLASVQSESILVQ